MKRSAGFILQLTIVAIFILGAALARSAPLVAQDANESADDATTEASVPAGHSYHGEAFNEGPRQEAFLMDGLGRARFPISTSSAEAQQFFNQGIDQLHGFWYFEAERSFRQVVILDPDCAMAYWGLAMANINNSDRAKEFIEKAEEKAAAEDRETSDREVMYIRALAAAYDDSTDSSRKRAENQIKKMEDLVLKYPDDIEAKAFLVCQIWMNQRKKMPITSYVAVDALLQEIFDVDPNHPAHHYRIHLWDYRDPAVALDSAALCGPSLPDIAHMWHMPGHIYSRLKRYEDAVWQQEASARVDHRNMMRDQVLPDQIHNFAHNNEWCVRNLNHVGRVRDAIGLAQNMISMPRHPKYNHLGNRGSTWYGRQRLLETLSRYELWEELIETCHSPVLEPTDDWTEQIKRLRHLGRAWFRSGQAVEGTKVLERLQAMQKEHQTRKTSEAIAAKDAEKRKTDVMKTQLRLLKMGLPDPINSELTDVLESQIRRDHRKRTRDAVRRATRSTTKRLDVLGPAIRELEGYQRAESGDYQAAYDKLEKADGIDPAFQASLLLRAGNTERALDQAETHVRQHKNEVQPLANLAWLQWQAGRKEQAVETFQKLRAISGSIDGASPVFRRLDVIARHAGISGDWRKPAAAADDLGPRPNLNELGPFRWQPVEAPEWELSGIDRRVVSSKQFAGEPVIVIFYLGHGCLHCAEQLQAFAPKQLDYQKAGIEMVAISTDGRDGLQKSIENYGPESLPIRLLADPEYEVFKAFRAFDEFEDQPLHGTFLIDGSGKIRWQDISYEPFMDPDFLLKESLRLLGQDSSESMP